MSRSTSLVVAENVSLRLPDDRLLFRGLTLGFHEGRTAVVGPNGSGKSSLLELLAGLRTPTSGRVRREGLALHLTQSDPDPAAKLTTLLGIEAPIEALLRVERGFGNAEDVERVEGQWTLRERAEAALARLGLAELVRGWEAVGPADDSPWLRPASSLSGGEATRCRLAGILLQNPDVLLLDEPTNHLDAPSRAALYEFVSGWDRGLVVATHDRELLRRVDRILELRALPGGTPRLVSGALDQWMEVREVEQAAAERDLDHARKSLREARRAARESAERQLRRNARGARQAALSNEPKVLLGTRKGWSEASTTRLRAQGERGEEEARQRLADARDRVEERSRIRFPLSSTGLRRDREVVRLEGAVLGWPEGRSVAGPLDLAWRGPVRVALTGPNGSGKSTLLRVLAGELEPLAGRVKRGLTAPEEVGLLRQDTLGPPHHAAETVLERLTQSRPTLDDGQARGLLARFLFPGDAVFLPVAGLSGGERLRLALAILLGAPRPPGLLLLDEPSNHLDLEGVRALEEILAEYDGALAVATHDRDLMEGLGLTEEVVLG